MNPGQFAGKTALVTGASRGIGKAIAAALGRHGAYVIGTATGDAGVASIRSMLEEENIQGMAATLNVNQPDSLERLTETLKDAPRMPDILVNNAGITRDNLLLRMKDEEWQDVLDTNLTSVFRLARLCLRPMVKARHGRIINITSVVAASGNPGQVNYAAAKAGITGFTKSLARELGNRNITVNAVAPGFIETAMTAQLDENQRQQLLQSITLGRLGRPEDVAAAVVFLASEEAAYITGETLHVNGGMYMA